MQKKILFNYVACSIISLFFLDLIGSKLHWYTSIFFYDMIMHFLGGVWLAFTFFWLFFKFFKSRKLLLLDFIQVILFVLVIGLFWEIFEILNYQIILKDKFDILDTISDLVCDLLGGTFVFFLLKKRLVNVN